MIFSEDNNNYSLKSSLLQSPDELNKGLWLVITGVNDIPPHIAIIDHGKYFSLTVRRKKIGESIDIFLKAISRRTTPTLFVPIKSEHTGIFRGSELRKAFEPYPTLGNGDHTCQWPIRDFFTQTYSAEFSNSTLVFELLAVAQAKGLLAECKSLFAEIPEDSIITLPKHTTEQIRERINSLLKVNAFGEN
ncbi:MAG: hypothetical protein ACLQQ4_17225 [Bacteroidia bacterium]